MNIISGYCIRQVVETSGGAPAKDIAKAMGLLKHAGYENVRGRVYPGMRHEILNEPKRLRVYKDIYEFLE